MAQSKVYGTDPFFFSPLEALCAEITHYILNVPKRQHRFSQPTL